MPHSKDWMATWGYPRPADNAIRDDTSLFTTLQLLTFSVAKSMIFTPTEVDRVMSSDVTKRTLSAGLGVGALTLLARRASADTPFSSFAFPATGAPTARTLPDRLAEIKNVKDFGAKGNGTTDDAPAILAALHSTRPPLSDPDTMSNTPWYAGVIFFPPGVYRVASPIVMNEAFRHFNVKFQGVGMQSKIAGDMGDFIFKRTGLAGTIIHGNSTFDSLWMNGFACIHWAANDSFAVRNCLFECDRGVWMDHEVYGTIDNCQFNGGHSDSLGAAIFANGGIGPGIGISNSRIQNFNHGIRVQGSATITNVSIEQTRTAVAVGYAADGSDYPATVQITGLGSEGNGIAIDLNWSNLSTIRSVSIQGHDWSPSPVFGQGDGSNTPFTGNKNAIRFNACTDNIVECVSAEGWFSGHVFDFTPGSSQRNLLTCVNGGNTENTSPTKPSVWGTPSPGAYLYTFCNNNT